jgi:hypothetical protein
MLWPAGMAGMISKNPELPPRARTGNSALPSPSGPGPAGRGPERRTGFLREGS